MRYSEFKHPLYEQDPAADAAQDDLVRAGDPAVDAETDDAVTAADQANGEATELVAGPPYPEEDMDSVRQMQTKLEELGYSVGSTGIDGKYGPRTTRAVRSFKQDFNISGQANVVSQQDLATMMSAQPVENPTPTGNEATYGRQGRRGGGVVDLPDPEGGGSGTLRINQGMGPLLDLDGSQSRLTQRDAGAEMQATIRMARRMAEIFGQPITINDAIAKAGTSRERDTQGSQHFHGTALDLDVSGFSDEEKLQLVSAAMQAGFTGFGFGQSILHVDRGPRRHWAYGNSTYGGVSVADLGATVTSGRAVV
jgi:peptidoglycan hydrolase-like protein with peptidoglycan-binding domain